MRHWKLGVSLHPSKINSSDQPISWSTRTRTCIISCTRTKAFSASTKPTAGFPWGFFYCKRLVLAAVHAIIAVWKVPIVLLEKNRRNAPFFWISPLSSWWLNQPIWKICSSNWKSSPNRGENKKYLKPPPGYPFIAGFLKTKQKHAKNVETNSSTGSAFGVRVLQACTLQKKSLKNNTSAQNHCRCCDAAVIFIRMSGLRIFQQFGGIAKHVALENGCDGASLWEKHHGDGCGGGVGGASCYFQV